KVVPLSTRIEDVAGLARTLKENADADIWNVTAFLPDDLLPVLYASATATLANSGHEPFGLVGLEAMAAGGVAFVGATGEEYARPGANAGGVEPDDGVEVASALRGLLERPALAQRLRARARGDAAELTWEGVIDGLLERLRFVCRQQGVAVAG